MTNQKDMPGGAYRASITKWGLSKTGTGKDQFWVRFKLSGRIDGDRVVDCFTEVERTFYRVITEKTIDFFVEELARLGYDRDNFSDLDPASPDAFDFEHQEIDVWLKYEQYEGKEVERWSLSNGGEQVKPLERKDVARLNASFGSKLKAFRGQAGRPQRAASAADNDPF